MKSMEISVAVLSCGMMLAGCATVTRGSNTKFTVQTTPPAASVKISTGFSCLATPCTMILPRKHAFDATISKAGFKSQTVHVVSRVAGGGVAAGIGGNALVGGVIGLAIDGSSGAMDELKPNPLVVILTAEDAAPVAPAPIGGPASPAPVTTPVQH